VTTEAQTAELIRKYHNISAEKKPLPEKKLEIISSEVTRRE
jgi:hypothetical protein